MRKGLDIQNEEPFYRFVADRGIGARFERRRARQKYAEQKDEEFQRWESSRNRNTIEEMMRNTVEWTIQRLSTSQLKNDNDVKESCQTSEEVEEAEEMED